ncbi:MAG TPA: hypothetical protein VMA73_33880 [Streptosporangiaceae bacterium]|nr:hypothetical protein [Streptosporangiaceae bacterium]
MPQLSDFDRGKLAAIFSKQHGLVARRQALACAMTAKALRYRTRPDGPWQVVLPGVYANERGRLSEKQRAVAAFLYSGRGIAITGTAATAFHGLRAPRDEFVDVLVPLHYRRSDAGFVRLRCTSIVPGVTFQDGVVSYVALDRAIADAVRQFSQMSEVRDLVASAVQRGKVDVWQLARELDLGPKQGSARLRLALAEVSDGVRSVAESDLRLIIRQFRLPAPLYNPRLYVDGKFLASPDAWWPDKAVAVEVESKAWHLSPADWERTLARRALMAAEGIVVVPLPPSKLRTAQPQVAKELRAALANSRGPLAQVSTRPVG